MQKGSERQRLWMVQHRRVLLELGEMSGIRVMVLHVVMTVARIHWHVIEPAVVVLTMWMVVLLMSHVGV